MCHPVGSYHLTHHDTRAPHKISFVRKLAIGMDGIVIVARHGERLDYVMRDRDQNWVTDAPRPYDPPLSLHGVEQAKKLGQHLARELPKRNLPTISAVYTSPFLRCRQTAAAATLQSVKERVLSNGSTNTSTRPSLRGIPKIRVEMGLSESINESWYRSWAMPYSDGTWGLCPKGESSLDTSTLHPLARQPISNLLNWKSTIDATKSANNLLFDFDYASKIELNDYSLEPRYLESRDDQRRRMRTTVEQIWQPGTTVLLVSHGGPATHLFEELTGKEWKEHGESSYCCYSIYRRSSESEDWESLVVNEGGFLGETVAHENHVSA